MTWLLWALAGWCGTPWRRPWWPPPPPPNGDPWYISKLAGVVGGLAGGWVYNATWPIGGNATGVDVAATAVGAVVGGILLGDVVAMVSAGRKA